MTLPISNSHEHRVCMEFMSQKTWDYVSTSSMQSEESLLPRFVIADSGAAYLTFVSFAHRIRSRINGSATILLEEQDFLTG